VLYEIVKEKTFGESIIGVVEVAIAKYAGNSSLVTGNWLLTILFFVFCAFSLLPQVPSDMWLQFTKNGIALHTELTFVPDLQLQTNIMLQQAASRSGDILSTGGGAVLNDLNRGFGTHTRANNQQGQVVLVQAPQVQPQATIVMTQGQPQGQVVMTQSQSQVMMTQGQAYPQGQVVMTQGQAYQGQPMPGQMVMANSQPMQGQGQQMMYQAPSSPAPQPGYTPQGYTPQGYTEQMGGQETPGGPDVYYSQPVDSTPGPASSSMPSLYPQVASQIAAMQQQQPQAQVYAPQGSGTMPFDYGSTPDAAIAASAPTMTALPPQ